MALYKNIAGTRFGSLVAIKIHDKCNGRIRWLVQCDCGVRTAVLSNSLRRGATTSCGCLKAAKCAKSSYRHGEANSRLKTPEWNSWRAMHDRCLNPRNFAYKDYGGRGISICQRWIGPNGYINFLSDMGRKPSSKHSIDRKNNDGNYQPSNCRWATTIEQANNRRMPKRKIYAVR